MSRLRGNPWAVLVVLCMGFFMVLLDLTIVNIAIPSIVDALKASLDQILWVLNAYTLTYAVLLITAGRLGDLYGQRNMFAAGLAIFTLASAACGLAQDPGQLIAARVVQGVGGALLTPQTLAIITTIFPAERRGAALGVWGAIAGVAAVTGPTLGGLLITYINFRWIFYVNVPIGIAAFAATLLVVPDLRPGRTHRVDLVGIGLATAGLVGITFGLIEGQRYSWGTIAGLVSIPLVIGAGLLLLVLFFAWDRRQAEPLVPFALFRERNFALMNWVGATIAFGMLGLFLPLTIYLQSALGYSPIRAGLTLIPMSLASMPLAPVAGRLADRFGGKYILLAGLTLFASGMAITDLRAGIASDWVTFLPGLVVAGIGLGFTFAPLVTVAMRNIPPPLAGSASGLLNTTRQLGGVTGSAVVGAVLQNRLATSLHDEAVRQAVHLPEAARAGFVAGFSRAGGLEIGRGQNGGGGAIPAGLPPQLVHQVAQAAHDTFAYGFINAMRPTLAVPVLILATGALSCLAIVRRARGRGVAAVPAEAPAGVERRSPDSRAS